MGSPLAHFVAGVALLVAGASAPVAAFAQASPWAGFILCAPEDGFCDAPAGSTVRFGATVGYLQSVITGSDGIWCTTGNFGGDPAGGYEKVCAYVTPDQPGENPDPNGEGTPHLPDVQKMAWLVALCWASVWGIKQLTRGLFL